MTSTYFIALLTFSAILSVLIARYSWRRPRTSGSRLFSLACVTFALWTLGDITTRLSEADGGRWAGEAIRFLGVCFLPVALLAFIRQYCRRPLSRSWIAILCVVPLTSWLMLATNEWHSLFFRSIEFLPGGPPRVEYGPFFWLVHLPYCYLLAVAGFATALVERRKASRHFRPQISILLLALSVPLIVNAIGIFKLFGDRGFTSLSFPAFFLITAFAMFRKQFLASNPIAYETVFETIRDGVVIFDRHDRVMDINRAGAGILGRNPGELIGVDFDGLFAPREELFSRYRRKSDFYDEIEIESGGKKHFVSVSITPLETSDGEVDGRIFTLRDITANKHRQFSLETLAFHDPLTRVANRNRFEEEVERAIAAQKDDSKGFAILYFDLDRFKEVNDTLGHETGDELLKYVAARVASTLRKPDLLARMGGDEFAALIRDCDHGRIDSVVDRIIENIRRPFKVGEHSLVAEVSFGASFYPENGRTLPELLRHADAAMYRVKRARRRRDARGPEKATRSLSFSPVRFEPTGKHV